MIFHLCREPISHKTEGFPMAYYSVDENHPRYTMMHHWHPEAEFLVLRKGTFTLILDGQTVCLKEGQFALIPSGTVHSGMPQDAWYECVVFDGLSLTDMLHGSTQKKVDLLLSQIRVGDCPNYLWELTEALQKKEVGYQTKALASLFLLLNEWLLCPQGEEREEPQRKKANLIPFEKTLLFIREHYSEPITLKALAEAAGLSEKYFGEYFRNITGKTPILFLNEYRTERAAELLKRREKSITEISMECGFNDLSYFIKTFRKHYGCTPNGYRCGN